MSKGIYDRYKSKPRPRKSIAERFWSKVDKTGYCWKWIAAKHRQGYGHFKDEGKVLFAHRVSWEFTNGPIPKGIEVMHSCDNTSCVNPAHLSLGTHKDNMVDMARKGRKKSKLRHLISDIFAMTRHGLRQQQIADYFEVSQSAISMVLNDKRLENHQWL